MKKLYLALSLIFPSIAAMAIEKPIIELAQSEDQAMTVLYDAELTDLKLERDGMCFKFEAVSVFDYAKKQVKTGKLCGDKILFNP